VSLIGPISHINIFSSDTSINDMYLLMYLIIVAKLLTIFLLHLVFVVGSNTLLIKIGGFFFFRLKIGRIIIVL